MRSTLLHFLVLTIGLLSQSFALACNTNPTDAQINAAPIMAQIQADFEYYMSMSLTPFIVRGGAKQYDLDQKESGLVSMCTDQATTYVYFKETDKENGKNICFLKVIINSYNQIDALDEGQCRKLSGERFFMEIGYDYARDVYGVIGVIPQ